MRTTSSEVLFRVGNAVVVNGAVLMFGFPFFLGLYFGTTREASEFTNLAGVWGILTIAGLMLMVKFLNVFFLRACAYNGNFFENTSDHPHPPYLQKICPQNMPYNGGPYGIKVG